MLPTTQGPVLMPMPTFIGRKGWPAASASRGARAFSARARSIIRSAASQAFASCAGSSSGAFQNAMMASPMYLSIVPLRSMMTLVSGVSSRFISVVRPCGSRLYCSEIVVKPRTSQNISVMSRSSPPSTSFSGDLRELLDEHGREVLAEGGADLPALAVGAQVVGEDEGEIDERSSTPSG